MYVFSTQEFKRRLKCDSCKRKFEPPESFFAYGYQSFAYDVVARRICYDCFSKLSVIEILRILRVSLKDSVEAELFIRESKMSEKK